MNKRSVELALCALVTSYSGCVSVTQFSTLEKRLQAIESRDEERRVQLENATHKAEQQVTTITEQLDVSRGQSHALADQGVRVDALETQLRALQGSLSEMHHALETLGTDQTTQRAATERRIAEIERRTGVTPAVEASQLAGDPSDLLTQARQALASRDFARVHAITAAIINRGAQDPLADDAHLLLGRSYIQENRAATAVQEFQHILTEQPSADTVPDTLTEMAEAFVKLGMCQPAQRTLRVLNERFSNSPQGRAARRRIDEIRALPATSCTSG